MTNSISVERKKLLISNFQSMINNAEKALNELNSDNFMWDEANTIQYLRNIRIVLGEDCEEIIKDHWNELEDKQHENHK